MRNFLDLDAGRTFILVSADHEPLPAKWGGEVIFVPPRDQVAVTAPKRPGDGGDPTSIYRWPAAFDGGRAVPGTVLIKDVVQRDPHTSANVTVFDAEDFIKGILAQPLLAERGLRVVGAVDQVDEARKDAAISYHKFQVTAARRLVQAEKMRRANYKEKGDTPPPLDDTQEDALRRALLTLEADGERRGPQVPDDALTVALGGTPSSKRPAPETPSDTDVLTHDDLKEMAAEVLKQVRDTGFRLSNDEQDALINRNADGMQAILVRMEAKATAAVA